MPRHQVLRPDGGEVLVSIREVSVREDIVEVASADGTWRFSVDQYDRPSLMTAKDAEGNLADLEIPDWMDDVLGRFDIRRVQT